MPYLIEKDEMPTIQYTPVKYKGEIAMLGITPNGPIIMFTALDQIRFVSWDEIVAFAATAPIVEPEDAKKKDDAPKKLREIKKPD
jgi:hypothetical protein